MLKTRRHHGIVYEGPAKLDFTLEQLPPGYNSIVGGLFDQCNGPIVQSEYQLLCFIPVDYVPNDQYVENWIKSCAEMGFPVVYLGKKPLSYIKNGCANNLKYQLEGQYGGIATDQMHVIQIKETDGRKKLAAFSMIRTLYPSVYDGIINTYNELEKKYPNEDKFKLFQFAIHCNPNFNTYRGNCNGSYHLINFSYNECWLITNEQVSFEDFNKRVVTMGNNQSFNLITQDPRYIKETTDEKRTAFARKQQELRTKLGLDFKKAISKKDYVEFCNLHKKFYE